MAHDRNVRWVLAAYPQDCHPRAVDPLGGAGGFSGALFWKVDTARGPLCLRCWPRRHPSSERLRFIHAVLRHVEQAGFAKVPVPIRTRENKGYVREAGRLWELAPWLSGKADYLSRPSPARLHAALAALAQFHQAASGFRMADTTPAPSPGIATRLDRVRSYTGDRLAELAAKVDKVNWPELAERADQVLGLFPHCARRVETVLKRAVSLPVPLQPCIRDVWHGHVLFNADEVTGLVDFGAMNTENVSADVARLLGSLVLDNGQGWDEGLQAYEAIRPLSGDEKLLLAAYDESGILLSGLNWLVWIFEEGRHFENRWGVLERLDHNLTRLRHLAGPGTSGEILQRSSSG